MKEKTKVLCICEDKAEADCISLYLLYNGFDVLPAANLYEDAVKVIDQFLPDIILLYIDPNNSEGVGFLTAEFILQQFHIPVVLSSAVLYHDYFDYYRKHHPVSILFNKDPMYRERMVGSLNVSLPGFENPLNKYKSREFKVTELAIQTNGTVKQVSDANHTHTHRWIALKDIAYLEACNSSKKNSILIWLVNNREFCFMIRGSLSDLMQLFPQNFFVRIHNSYIVNITQVDYIKLPHIIGIGHYQLPIGIRHQEQVKEIFDKSLFR